MGGRGVLNFLTQEGLWVSLAHRYHSSVWFRVNQFGCVGWGSVTMWAERRALELLPFFFSLSYSLFSIMCEAVKVR